MHLPTRIAALALAACALASACRSATNDPGDGSPTSTRSLVLADPPDAHVLDDGEDASSSRPTDSDPAHRVVHRLTVRGRIVDPDDRLLSGGPEVSVRMPGARPDGGDWVKSRDARRIEASGRFSAVLRDDEGYVLGHDAEIELFLAPRAMFFWRSSQPLSTERLEYVRLHVVATPLADPYDGAVVDLGDVVPTLLPVAATLEVRSERDESCLVRFFRHDGSGGNGTLGPETLEVPTNRTVEVYGWLDGPDEVWYVEGRAADGSERRVFAPWFGPGDHVVATLAEPAALRIVHPEGSTGEKGAAVLFPRSRYVPRKSDAFYGDARSVLLGLTTHILLDPPRRGHRNVLGDFYPPYEFDGLAPGDYVLEVWDAADVSKGPAFVRELTLPLADGSDVLRL